MKPAVRDAASQGLALGAAAALLWWLGHNTAVNLEARGRGLGFDFLDRPAGFDIGESWLAYQPSDSIGRAILVGLGNTALVAVIGWILSIGLGFGLGLARLSSNPVLRGLVTGVVETARNTPLLLLLLFLAATMHGLPSPRAAFEPVPGVVLSDRGLAMAYPLLGAGHLVLIALLVAALLARRRLGRWGLPVVMVAAAGLAVGLGFAPPGWSRPRLEGFNFAGGVALSPELVALVLALVLHHGAHISEVVRGAVLAVPRRQWEAGAALGLGRRRVMRLVVLPQALRAMVPLLANNCVSLVKNSSLAVAIGFPELVSVLNTTANQTGHGIETMLLMVVSYLSLSLLAAALLHRYNERLLRYGARVA